MMWYRSSLLLTVTGSVSTNIRAARARTKIYAIASFFGSMFSKVVPKMCCPRVLPSVTVNSFKDRGQGFLLAEPYLDDERTSLSHVVPAGASDHVVRETFKFSAFQFFVYQVSDRSIVFPKCTLVLHFGENISFSYFAFTRHIAQGLAAEQS